MSDDWKPGDLALCVDDRANPVFYEIKALPITRGGCYEVASMEAGRFWALSGDRGASLWLKGLLHLPSPFDARRFVKITPEEADEFDQEIIDAMTGIPVRV